MLFRHINYLWRKAWTGHSFDEIEKNIVSLTSSRKRYSTADNLVYSLIYDFKRFFKTDYALKKLC